MNRNDQIAIRKIIWGFLIGGGLVSILLLLVSLMNFEWFSKDVTIVGKFKDSKDVEHTISYYPSNAISSSSLMICSSENECASIRGTEEYDEILSVKKINDTTCFIRLNSKNNNSIDTLFFVHGAREKTVGYYSEYNDFLNMIHVSSNK